MLRREGQRLPVNRSQCIVGSTLFGGFLAWSPRARIGLAIDNCRDLEALGVVRTLLVEDGIQWSLAIILLSQMLQQAFEIDACFGLRCGSNLVGQLGPDDCPGRIVPTVEIDPSEQGFQQRRQDRPRRPSRRRDPSTHDQKPLQIQFSGDQCTGRTADDDRLDAGQLTLS